MANSYGQFTGWASVSDILKSEPSCTSHKPRASFHRWQVGWDPVHGKCPHAATQSYIEKKQKEKKRKGDLYRVFANILYIKLAQFLLIEFWVWELPTLHSFISGISPSFFKIIVHILLQISSKLGTIVIKIYTEVRIEVFKYLLCYKCVIWSQS